MSRTFRPLIAFALGASLHLWQPAPLAAAPAATEPAQRLFDEAKALMKAGNYAPACPKLRESQNLEPALGTLLNLADCYEHIGLIASAWVTFREAESVAKRDAQAAAERTAASRAEGLKARVPFLVIANRGTSEPTLSVRHAGGEVTNATWGTGMPLDPGEYEIRASAPGYRDWSTVVTLSTGGGTVTVSVPALDLAEAPRPVAEPASLPTNSAAPLAPAPTPASASHAPPLASWILFGTGAAAIGTSLVLGVVAKSQYDSSNCPHNSCATQSDYDDRKAALGKATAASVSFALGAALAGTGALVWALSPRHEPSASAARLELRAGFSSIALGGTL